MLAIIIGFLVGFIGVSIIRVIWYVFSWILIKIVFTIRKFSDRLQDGIINFVSVLYGNIKDAINNQHEYSVRNRNQR
ncbi:Sec62 family protein translocation protein [Staphylococcus epidermidis]|uniref:Sec62 family protein translocation protein n=1 Tax=Staphylococcus epidermidis TaxID=1282 RepID=UPI002094647B|nr:Sec62 family protein translocation protein [Staphylococcus epidermidis]MCO6217940.1 Sec62 family protein translocation protein [Staphylococcus epidermidis]